MEEKRI